MSAQPKISPIAPKLNESPRSWIGISASSTLLDWGIGFVSDVEPTITCHRCGDAHKVSASTARHAELFCSAECEGNFIRGAAAQLTVEDCIRLQARAEALFGG